jgi:Asp-tRNA(Asn)/Glu-tRNA(Gln) amidotransferase A subunit family amidase
MAQNVAKEDAVLVSALKRAGAIVFVKTTMPVTSMVGTKLIV